MKERKISAGKRFGFLVVLRQVEKGRHSSRWLCRCDCGNEKTFWAQALYPQYGSTVSCGCGISNRGSKHWNWKGGKRQDAKGYIIVTAHDHPNSDKQGRVLEHVLVMSKKLGRPLVKGEVVHHKNGIRSDNRLKNLELWYRGHPPGQKVKDMVAWCVEILKRYKPEVLMGMGR